MSTPYRTENTYRINIENPVFYLVTTYNYQDLNLGYQDFGIGSTPQPQIGPNNDQAAANYTYDVELDGIPVKSGLTSYSFNDISLGSSFPPPAWSLFSLPIDKIRNKPRALNIKLKGITGPLNTNRYNDLGISLENSGMNVLLIYTPGDPGTGSASQKYTGSLVPGSINYSSGSPYLTNSALSNIFSHGSLQPVTYASGNTVGYSIRYNTFLQFATNVPNTNCYLYMTLVLVGSRNPTGPVSSYPNPIKSYWSNIATKSGDLTFYDSYGRFVYNDSLGDSYLDTSSKKYFEDVITLDSFKTYEYYEIYKYWDPGNDEPIIDNMIKLGSTLAIDDDFSIIDSRMFKSNTNKTKTYTLYVITERGHTKLTLNLSSDGGQNFPMTLFNDVSVEIPSLLVGDGKPFPITPLVFPSPYSPDNIISFDNQPSTSVIFSVRSTKSIKFSYNGWNFDLKVIPIPLLQVIEVAVNNTPGNFNLYDLLKLDTEIFPEYFEYAQNGATYYSPITSPSNFQLTGGNYYNIKVMGQLIAKIIVKTVNFSAKYNIMEKLESTFDILEFIETNERIEDIRIQNITSSGVTVVSGTKLKLTSGSVTSMQINFLVRGLELPLTFNVGIISDDARTVYVPKDSGRNTVSFSVPTTSPDPHYTVLANNVLKKFNYPETFQGPYYNITTSASSYYNKITISNIETELLITIKAFTSKQLLIKPTETLKIKTPKSLHNITEHLLSPAVYEPSLYAIQNNDNTYTLEFPFTDIPMKIWKQNSGTDTLITSDPTKLPTKEYTFNSTVLGTTPDFISNLYFLELDNYESTFTPGTLDIINKSGYYMPINFIKGDKEIVGVIKKNSYTLQAGETLVDANDLPNYVTYAHPIIEATVASGNIDINYDDPILIKTSNTEFKILQFKVLDPVDLNQHIYFGTGEKYSDVLSNDPFYLYFQDSARTLLVNPSAIISNTEETIYFKYAELEGIITLHKYNGNYQVYPIYTSFTVHGVVSVRLDLNSPPLVSQGSVGTYSTGEFSLVLTSGGILTITKNSPDVSLPEMFINFNIGTLTETFLISYKNLPPLLHDDVYIHGLVWNPDITFEYNGTQYTTTGSFSGTGIVTAQIIPTGTFNLPRKIGNDTTPLNFTYLDAYDNAVFNFKIHFMDPAVTDLTVVSKTSETKTGLSNVKKFGTDLNNLKTYLNSTTLSLQHSNITLNSTSFTYTGKTAGSDNFIIITDSGSFNFKINCIDEPLDREIGVEIIGEDTTTSFSFPDELQNLIVSNTLTTNLKNTIQIYAIYHGTTLNQYLNSVLSPAPTGTPLTSLTNLLEGDNLILYKYITTAGTLETVPSTGYLPCVLNVSKIRKPSTFDSFRIIPSNSSEIKINLVSDLFNSLNGNFITSLTLTGFDSIGSLPTGFAPTSVISNYAISIISSTSGTNEPVNAAVSAGNFDSGSPIKIDTSGKLLVIKTRPNINTTSNFDNQGTYTFTVGFNVITESKNFLRADVTAQFQVFVYDPELIKQEIVYTQPNVRKDFPLINFNGTTNPKIEKIEYDGIELKGTNDDVISWASNDKIVVKSSKEVVRTYFIFMRTATSGASEVIKVYKFSAIVINTPQPMTFEIYNPYTTPTARFVNLFQEFFPLFHSQLNDLGLRYQKTSGGFGTDMSSFLLYSSSGTPTRTLVFSTETSIGTETFFSLTYTIKTVTTPPTLISDDVRILVPINTSYTIKSSDISPDGTIILLNPQLNPQQNPQPNLRIQQVSDGTIGVFSDIVVPSMDIYFQLKRDDITYPFTQIPRAYSSDIGDPLNDGSLTVARNDDIIETRTRSGTNITFQYSENSPEYATYSGAICYRATIQFYDSSSSNSYSITTYKDEYIDEYLDDEATGFTYNNLNYPINITDGTPVTKVQNNYVTIENNTTSNKISIIIKKDGDGETNIAVHLKSGLVLIYNITFITPILSNKKVYVLDNGGTATLAISDLLKNVALAWNPDKSSTNKNGSLIIQFSSIPASPFYSKNGNQTGTCSLNSTMDVLTFTGNQQGVWKNVLVDIKGTYSGLMTPIPILSNIQIYVETLPPLLNGDKYVSIERGLSLSYSLQNSTDHDIENIEFSNWQYSLGPVTSFMSLAGNMKIVGNNLIFNTDSSQQTGMYTFRAEMKSSLMNQSGTTQIIVNIIVFDKQTGLSSAGNIQLIGTNLLNYPLTGVKKINNNQTINQTINNTKIIISATQISIQALTIPIDNFSIEVICDDGVKYLNINQLSGEKDITTSYLNVHGNIFKNNTGDTISSFTYIAGIAPVETVPSLLPPGTTITLSGSQGSFTIKSNGDYSLDVNVKLSFVFTTSLGDEINLTTGTNSSELVEIIPYPSPEINLGNYTTVGIKETGGNIEYIKTAPLVKTYATFSIVGDKLVISGIIKEEFPTGGIFLIIEYDNNEEINIYSKLIKIKTSANEQIILSIPQGNNFTYVLNFTPDYLFYNQMELPGDSIDINFFQQGSDTQLGTFSMSGASINFTIQNQKGNSLPIGFYNMAKKTLTYLIISVVSSAPIYTVGNVVGLVDPPVSGELYSYLTRGTDISDGPTSYLKDGPKNIIHLINSGVMEIVNEFGLPTIQGEFDFTAITTNGDIRLFKIVNHVINVSASNPRLIKKSSLLLGRSSTGVTYEYFDIASSAYIQATVDSSYVEIPSNIPIPIKLRVFSSTFFNFFTVSQL